MKASLPVARLAQSVEHETLNLRVVGSSPTLGGASLFFFFCRGSLSSSLLIHADP